jgi:hypothetical protein
MHEEAAARGVTVDEVIDQMHGEAVARHQADLERRAGQRAPVVPAGLFEPGPEGLPAALADRAAWALAMPHPRPVAYAVIMVLAGSDAWGVFGGVASGHLNNFFSTRLLNERGRLAHGLAEILGFGAGHLLATQGQLPNPLNADETGMTYGLLGAQCAGLLAFGVGAIFCRAPQR